MSLHPEPSHTSPGHGVERADRLRRWLRRHSQAGIVVVTLATLLMFATAVWSVLIQTDRRVSVQPSVRTALLSLMPEQERPVVETVTAPAANAGATPSPTFTRTETVTRLFDSRCLLPPSSQPCDFASQARWDGDLGAWQAAALASGVPLPDKDEGFLATVQLKLEAGDPETLIATARAQQAPALFLAAARFMESVTEPGAWDVQVELVNRGAAPAPLSGLQLTDAGGVVLMVLAVDGAELPADARCWLSSGPPPPTPCAVRATRTTLLRGDAPAPLTLRDPEGQQRDALIPGVTAQ